MFAVGGERMKGWRMLFVVVLLACLGGVATLQGRQPLRVLGQASSSATAGVIGAGVAAGGFVGVEGNADVAPAPPSTVTATALDAARVRLTWIEADTNVTGFAIYDAATDALVGTTNAGATGYTLLGLSPSTEYCAYVAAFNQIGSSGASGAACATTLDPAAVPAPPVPVGQSPSVDYAFDDAVSADDRTDIAAGIDAARDYLPAAFGTTVVQLISVDVRSDPDVKVYTYYWNHQLVINTAHSLWRRESRWLRRSATAELYFSAMADELSHSKTLAEFVGVAPPAWLLHGAAGLFAAQAMAQIGPVPLDQIRSCLVWNLTHGPPAELSALETQDGMNSVGSGGVPVTVIATLAVDRLTAAAGISALRTYFEQRASSDWPVAFQQSFGLTPQEFYLAFDQSRAVLTRPSKNPCTY